MFYNYYIPLHLFCQEGKLLTGMDYKIKEKKLREKIGFKPFPGQKDIIDGFDKNRHVVICAGTRWGKTMLCSYLCLRELVGFKKRVWNVSPTYDLTKKVFRYLKEWIIEYFPKEFKIQERPFPRITSVTGSVWEGKSAENEKGLKGEELDLVIVDEAAELKPEVYERHLRARIASREGKSVLISTPKGRNWFYREYLKGKKRDNYATFRFKSTDGVSITEKEFKEITDNIPKAIVEQEYLAKFLADAAAVFPDPYENVKGELQDVEKGARYVMGVDLAKHRDFTVVIVARRDSNQVVHFKRWQKIPWSLTRKRVLGIAQRFNNAKVFIDSTGVGDPIVEDLEGEGIIVEPFIYTYKKKKQLIEKLCLFLEQQELTYPKIPDLLDELETFGYTVKKTNSGRTKLFYSAPSGAHDDCVNALALAVQGLKKKKEELPPIQKELLKIQSRRQANPFRQFT